MAVAGEEVGHDHVGLVQGGNVREVPARHASLQQHRVRRVVVRQQPNRTVAVPDAQGLVFIKSKIAGDVWEDARQRDLEDGRLTHTHDRDERDVRREYELQGQPPPGPKIGYEFRQARKPGRASWASPPLGTFSQQRWEIIDTKPLTCRWRAHGP